jgi:hypothetical protein
MRIYFVEINDLTQTINRVSQRQGRFAVALVLVNVDLQLNLLLDTGCRALIHAIQALVLQQTRDRLSELRFAGLQCVSGVIFF